MAHDPNPSARAIDLLAVAAIVCLGAMQAACVQRTATSCQTDDDCSEGEICGAAACVPGGSGALSITSSATTPDASSSDPPASTSTGIADATADATATSASTDDTSTPECTLNSQCGDTQRCDASGTCIELTSAVCPILAWPPDGRDDVVFLGSILPSGPPAFEGDHGPLHNATLLAIEDFNAHAALQGGQEIAWVGCDTSDAIAAAEHLRDAVGAPAIVGPTSSAAVRDVAEAVTISAGIFLITPTASAPSLASLDDDNLVWRMTPSDVLQANALVDRFVVDLSPTPQRLLVLVLDNDEGNELRALVEPELTANLPNVYFASYPGPETFPDTTAMLTAYGGILGDALTQAGIAQSAGAYDSLDDHYTHILILGAFEAEVFIVNYLAVWAQSYGFAPFPLVTVSHGVVPKLPDIVANVGIPPGTEPLLPLRLLLFPSVRGTSPDIFDPENFNAFNIRYKLRFDDHDPIASAGLSYDATLATTLAMVTVPADHPVTGAAIAAGMASLVDPMGVPIGLGYVEPIDDAVAALAVGDTVDLQGVSGALDWDPQTGEIRAHVLGWRLDGDPALPYLEPYCLYLLDPAPAEDGFWLDAGTGMPPCN
jgi:Periplasmic binding protein